MGNDLDLDIIRLYNEKDILLKKFKEGYNEISAGYGKKSNRVRNTRTRLARILVVYKPENKIFTHQYNKLYVGNDPFSLHDTPFDKEYSIEEFEKFVKEQEIVLDTKKNLSEILKNLNN
jgi:hypothetical protein